MHENPILDAIIKADAAVLCRGFPSAGRSQSDPIDHLSGCTHGLPVLETIERYEVFPRSLRRLVDTADSHLTGLTHLVAAVRSYEAFAPPQVRGGNSPIDRRLTTRR